MMQGLTGMDADCMYACLERMKNVILTMVKTEMTIIINGYTSQREQGIR